MQRQIFDFGFIGNEHPIKGLDILEELLIYASGEYKFALIGELPDLKKKYNKVKGFTFFGKLYGDLKKKVIEQCLVVCVPSYQESFSIVISEALSCGIPVVAFKIPSLESIYDKGVVFTKYGSAEKMWKTMEYIIKNPQVWKILSCQALLMSKKFDWYKSAKEVITCDGKESEV